MAVSRCNWNVMADRADYLRKVREPASFILESTADMMDAALIEIDRLSSAIENAPHDESCCDSGLPPMPFQNPCTCWKASV